LFYNLDYILRDIELHMEKKEPFSLVRLGDGDLKLLLSFLRKRLPENKLKQQGIPIKAASIKNVITIYRESCNNANYISSFDMYYEESKQFWPRNCSPKVIDIVKQWKSIYEKVGITNDNFCNPEIGFFFFLQRKKNLFFSNELC